MTSAGTINWQETVSSELGAMVSPTILHRLRLLQLVEQPARYTVLCCKLNLALICLEEELQILPTADTVSPGEQTFVLMVADIWTAPSEKQPIFFSTEPDCASTWPG